MSINQDITILYVDDEEPNRVIFQFSFQGKFNVITSASGKQGLEILEEQHDQIDVVVSDMRMPVMNGVEFVTIAKSKFDKISYFILTAFEYNPEIDNVIKAKIVQKFFTKPLDTTEIETEIFKTRLKSGG